VVLQQTFFARGHPSAHRAIFVFCDGAEKHLLFQPGRELAIQKAMSRGAGLMLYHFAVEPPAERGHQRMLAANHCDTLRPSRQWLH
jgi:hypothetical protein